MEPEPEAHTEPEPEPEPEADAEPEPAPAKKRRKKERAAPPNTLPDSLSAAAAQRHLRRRGKFGACGAGMEVRVVVSIRADGTVESADVKQPFALTPTGSCVAAGVRTMTFPPAKGASVVTMTVAL